MWKLNAPTTDRVTEELRRALTRANGSVVFLLDNVTEAAILNCYAAYDAANGAALEGLVFSGLGNELLNALQNAYAEVQDGRRLSALRERLKLATTICPYCGFGEVTELDHHLPQIKFKAFSIYPRNLVPSCHHCNNKKRTVGAHGADEQFTHVYFFPSADGIFLRANAEVSDHGLVVEFFIEQVEGMTDEVFAVLKFQLERLELNERYQKEINTFLMAHRTAIEDSYGNDSGNLLKD